MIVVGVGVQHADGKTGQAFDYLANVADAHAGIEQQGSRLPQDQVGDYFFRLMGFINGENPRTNPVSLKPRILDGDPFQSTVSGAGELLTPLRVLWRSLRSGRRSKQKGRQQ